MFFIKQKVFKKRNIADISKKLYMKKFKISNLLSIIGVIVLSVFCKIEWYFALVLVIYLLDIEYTW